MSVYVSGTPGDLHHAKVWLNDNRLSDTFADLDHALKDAELRLGPCNVFVECELPGIRADHLKSEQMDLLIAFANCVVFCEVKPNASHADNAAFQLDRRKHLLLRHLRRAKQEPESVIAFIWTPFVDRARLAMINEKIRSDNNHFRHICTVGGRPFLKGVTLEPDVPAYFPEALSTQLSGVPKGNRETKGAAATILEILQDSSATGGRPLLPFPDSRAVREYLRSGFLSQNVELVLESTHIGGLRASDLQRSKEYLTQSKSLEIIGPQRAGKSSFIKEVLINLLKAQQHHYTVLPRVMERADTVRAVLRCFASEAGFLEEDRIGRFDEEGLLRELSERDFVYWVKDYDRASYHAVMQLSAKLRHSAEKCSAFWIIESTTEQEKINTQEQARFGQVNLGPLDNDAMAAILRRHPASGDHDINSVISFARGIPGLAIARWTLTKCADHPKSERSDYYGLFGQRLNEDERPLLGAIAYILSESPLGMTFRLVEEWCQSITGKPAEDARRIARNVIVKASEWGLISVEVFGSNELAEHEWSTVLSAAWQGDAGIQEVARALVPSNMQEASVGWIRVLDPHFTEHFIRSIQPHEINQWRSNLEDVLIRRRAPDLSLTGVTFALLAGKYEAFVRSSFRSSSDAIPKVLSWIASKNLSLQFASQRGNSAVFKRWITWLSEHYWDHESTTKWQIEWADPTDPLQNTLADTVRVRGEIYRSNGACDWERWDQATSGMWEAGKYDLWAEALLRQAQTKIRPPFSNPDEAWNLVQAVLDQEAKLSMEAGRSLLYFMSLSIINKRKLWAQRRSSLAPDAPKLVPELVGKMIRAGIAMENVSTIANALFFFVRTIEIDNKPTTAEEINGYAAVLRFVERVSPARRVQALLTQGSLHRHYCAQDNLEWDEFRRHAERALEIYDRVLDSAGRLGMNSHRMTTLSYVGSMIAKSLRFGDDSRAWVLERCVLILPRLESVLDDQRLGAEPDRDMLYQKLLFNLRKHAAIQKWVVALMAKPESINSLEPSFADIAHMLPKIDPQDRRERTKNYQTILAELSRTFTFTRIQPAHRLAISCCARCLIALLTQTTDNLPRDPKQRSRVVKHANAVARHLSEAEIEIPTRLRDVLFSEGKQLRPRQI